MKRASLSSRKSPGGPSPTVPASTASVGARIAPSAIAAPSESAIAVAPNSAPVAIVAGITTPSKPMTARHSLQRRARLIVRPLANSATTSANSVRCSISAASSNGSIQSSPRTWMTAPAASASTRYTQLAEKTLFSSSSVCARPAASNTSPRNTTSAANVLKGSKPGASASGGTESTGGLRLRPSRAR